MTSSDTTTTLPSAEGAVALAVEGAVAAEGAVARAVVGAVAV
jgi:hypothetical protein